jgi:hypothetical protein
MFIDPTVFGAFIENALPDDHVHNTRVGYAATLPYSSPIPIDHYTHPVNQWITNQRDRSHIATNRETVAAAMYITTNNKLRVISALRAAIPSNPNAQRSLIGIHGDDLNFPQMRRLFFENALGNVVGVMPSTARPIYATCMADDVFHPTLTYPPNPNPDEPILVDAQGIEQLDQPLPPHVLPTPTFADGVDPILTVIPIVLPLPAHHTLPTDLDIDNPNIDVAFNALGAPYLLWLQAIRHLCHTNSGSSLHHECPALLLPQLHSQIPNHLITPLAASIYASVMPVEEVDQPAPRLLLRDLRERAHHARDTWIRGNQDLVLTLIPQLRAMMSPPTNPTPTNPPEANPPSASNITAELLGIETPSKRFLEPCAILRLLSVQSIPNPNDPTTFSYFIPEKCSDSIKTVFEAGTAPAQLHKLRSTLAVLLDAISNASNSIFLSTANIPTGIFPPAFCTALFMGRFVEGPIRTQTKTDLESHIHHRNLNGLTNMKQFATIRAHLSANELAIQEAHQSAHYKPTKPEHRGSTIFSSGDEQTLEHFLVSMANNGLFNLLLSKSPAEILQSDPVTMPLSVKFYQNVFDLFRKQNGRNFFATNGCEYPHLVHALQCDIHTTMTSLYRYATNPTNIHHVKNGDLHLVDFYGVTDFLDSGETFLADCKRMLNNGNVSSAYMHPPSTYVPLHPRHHQEHYPSSSPAAQRTPPRPTAQQRPGQDAKRHKSKSPSGPGSDPNKGWVILAPGAHYQSPPPLEGGSPCYNFITMGQSCSEGRECKFKHLTYPNLGVPANVPRVNNWIHTSPGLSFAPGFGPTAAPAPARRPHGTTS